MHMPAEARPAISVIMGALYKRTDLFLLKRSVDSILNQTLTDFEFLICDDYSVREAKELIENYSRTDSRVKLIRAGDKLSLAAKLNACLKVAAGEYIARMDDDDAAVPDRLEKQVNTLRKQEDISFAGSNVAIVRDGRHCGEWHLPEYPEIRDFYITQPYIHPTLVFRKSCLDKIGGYSESDRQVLCEDYDLLLRLYGSGYRGRNLQENLLVYTIPSTAKGARKMRHRWNETVTRWERFRDLDILPGALPYVFKPLAAGLLPESLLRLVKSR